MSIIETSPALMESYVAAIGRPSSLIEAAGNKIEASITIDKQLMKRLLKKAGDSATEEDVMEQLRNFFSEISTPEGLMDIVSELDLMNF